MKIQHVKAACLACGYEIESNAGVSDDFEGSFVVVELPCGCHVIKAIAEEPATV